MVTDERYKTAKRGIQKNQVKELHQVFKYIPKNVVAKDIGTSLKSFSYKLNHIEKFSLREIFAMAQLFEVDTMILLKLANTQYEFTQGILPVKSITTTIKSVETYTK